jgi:tRNA(Ile)-lysidine synthase TilS/MesJ
VLRGIDYIVEECPVAEGNKHLGYKEALNAIEVQSPGTKHDFYFGFLRNAADRFPTDLDESGDELLRCTRCGAPTTSEVCAFCRLAERASGAEPVRLGEKRAGRR